MSRVGDGGCEGDDAALVNDRRVGVDGDDDGGFADPIVEGDGEGMVGKSLDSNVVCKSLYLCAIGWNPVIRLGCSQICQ